MCSNVVGGGPVVGSPIIKSNGSLMSLPNMRKAGVSPVVSLIDVRITKANFCISLSHECGCL